MNLEEAIKNQYDRYPKCETTDLIKFIYQYTLGPNHAIKNYASALANIKAEASNGPSFMEKISDTYTRFHFNKDNDLECLCAIFCASSTQNQNKNELIANLNILKQTFNNPLIDEYIAKGCPTISHSQTFKANYDPHYRLINNKYANYYALYEKLYHDSTIKVIAIDGNCASGKTSLANDLKDFFKDCAILHIDDFYLPKKYRKETWLTDIAGNINIEYIKKVLENYQQTKQLNYQPFDCHTQSFLKNIQYNNPKLLIVEGSYALHPTLIDNYDLKIFLNCDQEKQLKRLNLRNEDLEQFQNIWIPKELAYFKKYSPNKQCEFTFNTSNYF